MVPVRNACLVFLALVPVLLTSVTATSRDLSIKPGQGLAARLESSGSSLMECWNELAGLKSGTNWIVVFFVNGETSIGPDCCRAIEIITLNCWPATLTSLSFTVEEGNILRSYCDAAAASSPPTPLLW